MEVNASKKLIAALCVAMLILIQAPYSRAATTAENIEKSIVPGECKQVLIYGDPARGIKGFEPELKDFFMFLDSNFKNKSSTSSLVPLAIARYAEYRDSLRRQFQKVQIAGTKKAESETSGLSNIPNFEQQVKDYALCQEIVNTYISLGREQMLKHVKTAAAQKKTVMLLEKLKALNVKLRGLNMKISEMFALFKTFKEKFPGYSDKKCMKSL